MVRTMRNLAACCVLVLFALAAVFAARGQSSAANQQPGLVIAAQATSSAILGSNFSFPLVATGGSAPYSWRLVDGQLPPGLKSVCENSTKHLFSSGQLRHKESMSRFKPYRPEQAYLLPPSVKDVLGTGHLCFFVQQVMGQLDLSPFEQHYSAEGGELYAVPLMLSVWLYAYATGLTSARELERRIREDLPLRYLAGGAQPDHWALSAFRRQHGRGINEVFTQTLELVRDAGLGKLGIVAVDSTPIAAHNGKQRVDTRQRLRQERAKYRRQVRHWQKQCDAAGAPVAAEYAAERVQQRLAE